MSEVLLYPDDLDRDYVVGRREVAGMAHIWGTVILSVPSLQHSFAYYEDSYHVGFHEFAHLLWLTSRPRAEWSGAPTS